VLADLPNEQRRDYESLRSALSKRFGTENRSEVFRAMIKARTKRRNETLPELAQDMRRLTRQAYPSATAEFREILAKDFFLDALGDADAKWTVQQARPSSLDKALDVAMELEAFQMANSVRPRDKVPVCENEYKEAKHDFKMEIEGMKQTIKQLLQTKPRRGGRCSGCWTCGELDHIRRDCKQWQTKQCTVQTVVGTQPMPTPFCNRIRVQTTTDEKRKTTTTHETKLWPTMSKSSKELRIDRSR